MMMMFWCFASLSTKGDNERLCANGARYNLYDMLNLFSGKNLKNILK